MNKSIKKTSVELKKLVSSEDFGVKNQNAGVTIEGFANKATVDRGDELVATDAWQLDNFKKNPIILFNHGMDSLGGTPIGKATEVRPTENGLFLKVKLSNSKAPMIQMVRDLVEERILKAFSVGFNPIETENVDIDGKSVRKITKAELFEVSVVGIPMNQDSLFDISEKALQTKSFHQVKLEVLKAKGAEKAALIEDMIGEGNRKATIAQVLTETSLNHVELLDMLAGDRDVTDEVVEAVRTHTKQANVKEILEAALASLGEGSTPDEVAEAVRSQLRGDADEEAEGGEEEEPETNGKADEEEESEESGEAGGESTNEGDDSAASAEEGETSDDSEEDPKRKADFQDCVAAKVPKLIEEGRDQDEAVAVAISQCQEEGKCQLTPESKQAVFSACFEALDAGETITFTGETVMMESSKQVDEEQQGDQAPTTPIKTEPSAEDFGSPFLEAAKQTNVLLGALINEFQKLSAKLDGAPEQNAVQSEEVPPKDSQETSEESSKENEDHAKKALDTLDTRLKNLGY